MSTLPKQACPDAIASLGGFDDIVLKRLGGLYQNQELRLFNHGKSVYGEHHLIARTDDANGYLYTRVRAPLTFFSRWRCVGIDVNGVRFVLYNPDQIARAVTFSPRLRRKR